MHDHATEPEVERGLGPLGRFLVRRRPLTAVALITAGSVVASLVATVVISAALALPLPWEAYVVCMAVPVIVAPLATTSHVLLMHRFLDERARVRELSRMLPICAWCKKIRDDSGYWQQLERYLATHAGAEFTHALCPDCYVRIQAEGGEAKAG